MLKAPWLLRSQRLEEILAGRFNARLVRIRDIRLHRITEMDLLQQLSPGKVLLQY